jgi:general secretion pathway protein I
MTAQRQRGFSLLEVLVAFAILALTLGVLLNIFSRASRSAILSAQYSQAAALAESKLAAIGTEFPLAEGGSSGEPENGFAWEINVFPVEFTTDEPAAPELATEASVTPYQLTATVLWREGERVRRLTFATVRLGAAADAVPLDSAAP